MSVRVAQACSPSVNRGGVRGVWFQTVTALVSLKERNLSVNLMEISNIHIFCIEPQCISLHTSSHTEVCRTLQCKHFFSPFRLNIDMWQKNTLVFSISICTLLTYVELYAYFIFGAAQSSVNWIKGTSRPPRCVQGWLQLSISCCYCLNLWTSPSLTDAWDPWKKKKILKYSRRNDHCLGYASNYLIPAAQFSD